MTPRPSDLAALARVLPPKTIALSFDLETCADPAGGDARVPGKTRTIQLGIAAFSSAPMPETVEPGEPVYVDGPASDLDEVDKMLADFEDDAPTTSVPDVVATPERAPVGYLLTEETYVDPQCRIDAGSAKVHRITDAQVRGAPTIAQIADYVAGWFVDREVILCGYNATKYDVPALAAEMRRVGRADVAMLLTSAKTLDCLLIRRANDPPFTLGGTLARYGLPSLGDAAHSAGADAQANLAVLAAQASCGCLSNLAAAADLGTMRAAMPVGAVDAQGKLQWVGGQAPDPPVPTQDNIVYGFSKYKGQTLRAAGAGMGRWLCANDFGEDAKAAVRAAFGKAAAKW